MRSTQPLTVLSKHWNKIRGHGNAANGTARSRRRNRTFSVVQTASLHGHAESLESRLLLTVTAPASATTIEGGQILFGPNGQGAITVTEPESEGQLPLQVTLIVNNGTLALGNTTGLMAIQNNNTRAISFVGTPSNINTDLQSLQYGPNIGYTGDDTLLIIAGNNAGQASVPIFINSWTNSTASSAASQKTAAGNSGIDVSLLLPNGDLMVHRDPNGASAVWYEITPDSAGSYADGKWTKLALMNHARLYFSSDVLPNGDVFVYGGEYASDGAVSFLNRQVVPNGTPGSTRQYSDSGEIYDPSTNVWTPIAPGVVSVPARFFPGQTKAVKLAGDQPSEVLPDGDVLVGDIFDAGTEIYVPQFEADGTTPEKGSWTTGRTRQYANAGEESDEESWVKLGNGDILNYDIYASENNQNGVGLAELYEPGASGGMGQWVPASNGNLPILASTSSGSELGPALLEPGTGDAVFFGANGLTAIYDPTANSWSQGPTLPSSPVRNPSNGQQILTQFTMGDAPAAVLPNGDFLLALSPAVSSYNNSETFPAPTRLYEWNPQTNVFVAVGPVFTVTAQAYINSFQDSMLVLPTGQVLLTNSTKQLAFYTLAPNDGPQFNWLPTIASFTYIKPPFGGNPFAPASYTLTGTQLNGPDEGAAYGDDEQMAENYPIVELSDGTGRVYFATTSYWSSNGVATGNTSQSVIVTLPTMPSGTYSLTVIADGISSVPLTVVLGGFTKNPGPFPIGAVSNEAVANVINAAPASGVAASSGLGSGGNSVHAPIAPTSSVASPTSSLDQNWNKLKFPTGLRTQEQAAAFESVPLSAALSNSEIDQWAGLKEALEILSA